MEPHATTLSNDSRIKFGNRIMRTWQDTSKANSNSQDCGIPVIDIWPVSLGSSTRVDQSTWTYKTARFRNRQTLSIFFTATEVSFNSSYPLMTQALKELVLLLSVRAHLFNDSLITEKNYLTCALLQNRGCAWKKMKWTSKWNTTSHLY